MSKASEWAEKRIAAKIEFEELRENPPQLDLDGGDIDDGVFAVIEDPEEHLENRLVLNQYDAGEDHHNLIYLGSNNALILAQWILDTFREDK